MRTLSISLLFFVSFNALFAGITFIVHPDGTALGRSLAALRNAPFKNFYIPGLVLFIIHGVFNMLAAILILMKWRYAYIFLSIQGLLLVEWIFLQILFLREFNFLHALLGVIGFVLFYAGNFLERKTKESKFF